MGEAYQIRDQEIEPKEKFTNWENCCHARFHVAIENQIINTLNALFFDFSGRWLG